jgi:hypothetical protein
MPRYKFKIWQMVKIKNSETMYNDKIGCIIEREHPERLLEPNFYKIVVCGKPDYPVWIRETCIERFE